ncbi:MAG: VCBS repeat-containing protein, partial [Fuerstiella sp.]|nr:VCBS repeat-containing protein [Fuerstiella sp.]
TNFADSQVSILLGDGGGSFTAPTSIHVGAKPRSVSVADFNGDGIQDLAAANFDDNNVSSLLGEAGVILPPIVAYASPDEAGSLTLSPISGRTGVTTVMVTVEDGGFDNELNTSGDNARVSQEFVVTVIEGQPSAVVGRQLFYNNSRFDDPGLIGDPAVNANDDGAIATDKVALQAGTLATFANYTSYSRGINGIMIDIDRGDSGGPLIAEDFEFKVGNTADPSTWAAAPTPNGFAVRTSAGANGSDRVTFTWADGTIKNQWLQVTVKANANTGLPSDDVHYWGHQFGETGNNAATTVNFDDTLLVLNNPSGFTPALIDNAFDINRDARVNFDDTLLVLNNPSGFSSLLLFNPPAPPPPPGDPSAFALLEVADSTVAEAAPVQPVRPVTTAGNDEPSTLQSADEHKRHTPNKTPAPVLQTVASESSSAETSRFPEPVPNPKFDSDDLWIAAPGEITLGRFFPFKRERSSPEV